MLASSITRRPISWGCFATSKKVAARAVAKAKAKAKAKEAARGRVAAGKVAGGVAGRGAVEEAGLGLVLSVGSEAAAVAKAVGVGERVAAAVEAGKGVLAMGSIRSEIGKRW
jgi:hypothetical protein